MKTDPCPALSARSRTFATITAAAGALKLPVDALRMGKARGCPAFRPNSSVNERELVEWLLVDCREFWGELLGELWSEGWEFPAAAAEWREVPPDGLDLLDVREPVFQWLRLVHGDEIMAAVKAGAESALADLASTIPPCLLDGSAMLPFPRLANGEPWAVERIFRPATFPLEIPAWRMDLSPFEVVQANRVEFWQWSERLAGELCEPIGRLPMPPKFLILSNQEATASRFPIQHHEPMAADYWERWAENYGTPRSLLDFLPPAAPPAPPAREGGDQGKTPRKPPASRQRRS